MSVTDLCTRGRLLSQVSMAGLVATCGRCLLLLLVLCTPDAATLSLPFQTRDLLPAGPHPGGGHTRSSHPHETDFLTSGSSSSKVVSNSLRALARLALAQRLRQGREYYGGGAGGGGGRWANRQSRGYINGIKRKRQGKDRGFFGIDNPDFVLRTLELKNAARTASPLDVTTEDDVVARVALINAERMRNRQRQRVRTRPGRPHPSSPPRMSVDASIEDLRRLMEKQGR